MTRWFLAWPHLLQRSATSAGDQRLLDLTGIGTDELRSRVADPVLLAALLAFLEVHEPDLVSVAAEIGVDPAALTAARRQFEGN
jgi:hypothetical protein